MGEFDDLSNVEKFELSEDDYSKRNGELLMQVLYSFIFLSYIPIALKHITYGF